MWTSTSGRTHAIICRTFRSDIVQGRRNHFRRTRANRHYHSESDTIQDSILVLEQAEGYRRWQGLSGSGKRNGKQITRGFGATQEDSCTSWSTTLLGLEGSRSTFQDHWKKRSHCRCEQEEGLVAGCVRRCLHVTGRNRDGRVEVVAKGLPMAITTKLVFQHIPKNISYNPISCHNHS